jgi:hypothetical protein
MWGDTSAVKSSSDKALSADLEVSAADGSRYRVLCQRRGTPLRAWDGVDTALPALDFLVFLFSLARRVFTFFNVRFRRGWIIGVLQETELGWSIVHREELDDGRLAQPRMQELIRSIEAGSRIG